MQIASKLRVIFLSLFLVLASILTSCSIADQSNYVYVTAKLLNGRMTPSKNAIQVARFDKEDILELTGRWSKDREWVEVVGGESGNCWVYRKYVNEISESYTVTNTDYKTVKIRKKPWEKSKVTGYLRRGRSVEITKVLMGWGKCKLGWIDLYYVNEFATETPPTIEEAISDP